MSHIHRSRQLWFGAGVLFLAAAAGHAQAPASGPADFAATLAAARPRAIDLVCAAARSQDVAERAHGLEAAQYLPERATPLLALGLEDQSPVVRYVAAVTIGKLKVRDLAPAVRQRLAVEQAEARDLERLPAGPGDKGADDQTRRRAAMLSAVRSAWAADLFALHQCGQDADLGPLAEMLTREDGLLRGNVATLLGLMGDRSAVALLKDRVRLTLPRAEAVNRALLNLQYAEALVRLGEGSYLQPVRAAVYSPFPEVRVLALSLVGDLDDKTQVTGLVNLLTDPDVETMEVRLAAAGALAQFGDRRGAQVITTCAQAQDARLRAFATKGLGALGGPAEGAALAALLQDPDAQVRLAAAAAVLHATAAQHNPGP